MIDCRMCEDLGERNGEPCSCLSGRMVSLGRDVDADLECHGEPHSDHATEIKILRWALGYRPNERDPWTGRTAT